MLRSASGRNDHILSCEGNDAIPMWTFSRDQPCCPYSRSQRIDTTTGPLARLKVTSQSIKTFLVEFTAGWTDQGMASYFVIDEDRNES